MVRLSYTKEELKKAAKNSYSKAMTLRSLGIPPAGGNYKILDKYTRKWNIDTSHFTGKGHLKGKTHNWAKKIPLTEILVKNSNYSSNNNLKKRLKKANLIKTECYKCGITEWHGQKLSLHLDHINGNNLDNRIENLRMLCPNCHSLTKTYCGRNKKNRRVEPKPMIRLEYAEPNECEICRKQIHRTAKKCKDCSIKTRPTKITWPPTTQLVKMVKKTSYCAVAKKLGISDNAVRKRIKNHFV